MLDKSIPYHGVLMVHPSPSDFPRYPVPEGFVLSGYRPGFEEGWARLIFSLGQTGDLAQAREIFRREFLSRPDQLARQCLFLLTRDGGIAATASLWYGSHFGRERYRVHWVSVAERYQGRGLAKALLSQVMEIYQTAPSGGFLYLTSQTWSYKALGLYETFGFRPYLGPRPQNWRQDAGVDFEDGARLAWALIRERIGRYRSAT